MCDKWEVPRIGDVAEVFDGPHATPHKTDAGPWFLSISSLQAGRLALEESAHLSEEDFARWTRRVTPQSGDVLFSYETRLGEAAIMPAGIRACLGRRMGLLRPWNEINPRFLLYAYLSPQFQAEIYTRTVRGATVDRIPLNELGDWPISIPDRVTQDAIADVLGALDDKIEANGHLRAVCTSLLRATFERLARPGLMAVASGSDLPSGWLRGPLDKWLDVLETGSRPRGGVSKYKHGVPSLGAESVSGLAVFDYSKTKYVPEDYFASMRRGIVQNCDVLLYKDGGRPGQFEPHVAMLGEGFPFSTLCINEHVYRLRARAPMTQEYLFCWLSSEPMLEEMRRRGTGVAIPGLNSSAVKALPAGFPANGETAEFSALATDLVKQALSSAKEDRLLAELRDTLLPPLLCGELRVHDAEALVEGVV
jgi:type I restriction enzyme S subunit